MHTLPEPQLIELVEQQLERRTETDHVEFIEAAGGLSQTIWRSISSFSNTPDGGVIVFGVKERSDKTLEVMGVKDLSKPRITPIPCSSVLYSSKNMEIFTQPWLGTFFLLRTETKISQLSIGIRFNV
jgi:hypothetical protein